MWTMINLGCGHKEERQIYGSKRERERKIWTMENYGECDECKKARQKREQKEAEDIENAQGWPELQGSEKQIAWAKVIRHQKYRQFEQHRDRVVNDVIAQGKYSDEEIKEGIDKINASEKELFKNSSSNYWIDNRNTHIELMLYEMARKRN